MTQPKGWSRVSPKDWGFIEECSDADAAYLAGIIDGEGSVTVSCTKRNANFRGDSSAPVYVLEVCVVNTDKALIDWLQARFGGNVNLRARPADKSYWKPIWRWRVQNRHAETILRRVRPWLIVKARQADLGFVFRQTYREHSGRWRPTEADIQKRQGVVDQLRADRDYHRAPEPVA